MVISGHGNDAAIGASAVHRSMLQATIGRDHAVDHIVALEDIPALPTAMTITPLIGDSSRAASQ